MTLFRFGRGRREGGDAAIRSGKLNSFRGNTPARFITYRYFGFIISIFCCWRSCRSSRWEVCWNWPTVLLCFARVGFVRVRLVFNPRSLVESLRLHTIPFRFRRSADHRAPCSDRPCFCGTWGAALARVYVRMSWIIVCPPVPLIVWSYWGGD